METRYDMDSFEQTLKQHADHFSMVPTKRVWNGVYNSMHPGSKWPSLTMLLFFLLTLVGIGPLNHSSKNYSIADLPDNTQSSVADENESKVFTINTYLKSDSYLSKDNSIAKVISLKNNSTQSDLAQNILLGSKLSGVTEGVEVNKLVPVNENFKNVALTLSDEITKNGDFEIAIAIAHNVNIPGLKEIPVSLFTAKGVLDDKGAYRQHSIIPSENIIIVDSHSLESFLKLNKGNSILIGIENIDNEDAPIEAGIEGTTSKKYKKRNNKTTWIFFATPAITSTYFTGKSPEDLNPLINNSPLIVNPRQIGNTMRYNARVGLNLGAEINYGFANNWEIVTGTQLSYLGYNILAHKVHPTFSYLYLKDETNSMEMKKYITYYGSGEGPDEIVLHNNSLQLSIPIGIKHSVWKNDKVEIKIGTSIQPSVVVSGKAHILSSDGRNYVNDPDLMRPVNVSGEFNSSISFQGDKVKWHVGPTIRFQALSSYNNIYPVNEHLIDYGIRIGISKK